MTPISSPTLPNRTWPFIWHVLKTLPLRIHLFAAATFLCLASIVCIDFYMFYAFKLLVDGIASASDESSWSMLPKPFWTIVSCIFLHVFLWLLKGICDRHSVPYIQNRFREILTEWVLQHNQNYFNNRFSGNLTSKISNVVQGYNALHMQIFLDGLVVLVFAIFSASWILWGINPWFAGLLWGIVSMVILWGYICGPSVGKAAAKLAESEADIQGQLVDTVGNISSVRNYTRALHEINLLKNTQMPFMRAFDRFMRITFNFWGIYDGLLAILMFGFVGLIITQWKTYHLTPGDITTCAMIAWDLWWRMGSTARILTLFSQETGRIQEALTDIIQPHDIVDRPSAPTLAVTQGSIVFKDVAFAYASGHRVFESFNLTIAPAQRVGLVGLSGAGKTTLCQLLLRNYDIQSGEIRMDGQNIADVTQDSLRSAIAVIPQDPSLFHRSLRDNIAYGAPDTSEEQIIAAAKAAQAHEFIMALKDKYDSLVGERGVKLSGGQRQRIAIARAILKNAPILLLDEATSSLDSQTERAIQAAFHTAMEGRTTLVVAHRLSTLAHLDRLIVLRDGQIIEDGNLSELLAKDGHFAHLWRLQADGFLPEKLL